MNKMYEPKIRKSFLPISWVWKIEEDFVRFLVSGASTH